MLFNDSFYSKAPHLRREGFPGWSWAGWHFAVVANVASPYDAGFSDDKRENDTLYGRNWPEYPFWIRREVAWFHLEDAANNGVELESSWIGQDDSAFYVESKCLWEQSDPLQTLNEMQKKFLEANIASSHALTFWTQSVCWVVDREKDELKAKPHGILGGYGSSFNGFPVRDNLNRVIGFINITAEYRTSPPDKLEFIQVAQNRRWEHKLWPLLDLLHVETIGDITFRVQVIWDSVVRLGSWSELNPEWKFIFMASVSRIVAF